MEGHGLTPGTQQVCVGRGEAGRMVSKICDELGPHASFSLVEE